MLYPHSLFSGLLALAGSARGHALAQASKPWPGHRTSVKRRLAHTPLPTAEGGAASLCRATAISAVISTSAWFAARTGPVKTRSPRCTHPYH